MATRPFYNSNRKLIPCGSFFFWKISILIHNGWVRIHYSAPHYVLVCISQLVHTVLMHRFPIWSTNNAYKLDCQEWFIIYWLWATVTKVVIHKSWVIAWKKFGYDLMSDRFTKLLRIIGTRNFVINLRLSRILWENWKKSTLVEHILYIYPCKSICYYTIYHSTKFQGRTINLTRLSMLIHTFLIHIL